MNVVTFCDFDETLLSPLHDIECFDSESSRKSDVIIMDMETIFDFEENKEIVCADKYVSLAIIDDDSDYDVFKNFGIDTWIKRSESGKINEIIELANQKLLS